MRFYSLCQSKVIILEGLRESSEILSNKYGDIREAGILRLTLHSFNFVAFENVEFSTGLFLRAYLVTRSRPATT